MTTPDMVSKTGYRLRLFLVTAATALAAADLAVKVVAEHALAAGQRIDLGLVDLSLVYNPGVAFGVGAALPTGIVLTAAGLIVAGIAAYAWRTAASSPPLGQAGLAAILAGGLGNLIDRGLDGVVTDYLHTGWWPTFNLADVLISCGAITTILAYRKP